MTMKTLSPENRSSKKKEGEILRFQDFMASLELNPEQIQKDTGVSVRTITNSIYENHPLGAKLLRQCHLIYGVSIDWVVSGVGSMMVTGNKVAESHTEYTVDSERLDRIAKCVDEWLLHATEDEKTWLELSIKQMLVKNWPPLGVHHD